MMIKALAALFGLASLAQPASAAQKAAVLPFEIVHQVQEEDFFAATPPEVNTEENQRLVDAAQQLSTMMRDSGRYETIELKGLEEELQKSSPLYKCGCEADLGKKVGADVVVTGLFEKASDFLTSVTVREHDLASGKVRSMKAVMQGNTDVSWQNVIRWIAKNKLLKAESGAGATR